MTELSDGAILVVDDAPETSRGILGELGAALEVVHPDDLDLQQLERAHVVLVDHRLEDHKWTSRASFPVACRPMDGIALGHLLLGHFRTIRDGHTSPTAVGIISNELDSITPEFTNVPEHLAARATGLHWAFWKHSPLPHADKASLTERIGLLAAGVDKLPRRWRDGDQLDVLRTLLGLNLPDASTWSEVGLGQALRCRPPIHELATWTSGTVFIRWLAQLVLPYPSFLLNSASLSLKLGIHPDWFCSQIQSNARLAEAFQDAEYRGILAGFLGRRWWNAGIHSVLSQAGPAVPSSRQLIAEWITQVAGEAPPLVTARHTLVLNERTTFDSEVAEFDDCVRLQLDDWPSFSEIPWTTKVLAQHSARLRGSVHPEDIERLSDGE